MKTRTILLLLLPGMGIQQMNGQNSSLELTFTARNDTVYQAFDSVLVRNLTHPGDTMLLYPDTTFTLTYYTGISQGLSEPVAIQVSMPYPNPFNDQSAFSIELSKTARVKIGISDMLGREVAEFSETLNLGEHEFTFYPGRQGQYLLSVCCEGQQKSIKLSCTGSPAATCRLIHHGEGSNNMQLKNLTLLSDFWYFPGDKLLFIAYSDTVQSGINDVPAVSTLYTFQFATNIPCPGMDSVLYDNSWYPTVQIFSQCWLKKNLNVGQMINSSIAQSNNGIIEKYCMTNNANSCNTYGGIYTWDELMQYTTEEGSQGICPAGWHIPTDNDWKILAGAVDSYYKIGNPVWNNVGEFGLDAGYNLKSTSGWYNNGNGSDLFDFSAISGGYLYLGNWAGGSMYTVFFTSSRYSSAQGDKPYTYGLSWVWDKLGRGYNEPTNAMPIRCLKNNQ